MAGPPSHRYVPLYLESWSAYRLAAAFADLIEDVPRDVAHWPH